MSSDQYLFSFARKCGLENEHVVRKAKELLNVLESKGNFSCSESCKVAVCLEIASNLINEACNCREDIIKYSGCKKTVYKNTFNNISKILNVDKVYSVKEICLNVGVSELQPSALKLLESYQIANNLTKTDLEHPMYPCAATFAICRINKVKINLSSILEISRIKKAAFEALVKNMEMVHEKNAVVTRKRPANSSTLDDTKEESAQKTGKESKVLTEEEKESEYLKWKERMLSEL